MSASEAQADPFDTARCIELAIRLGLDTFHHGSCGPAAVAINRVLFKGKGTYVVLKHPKEWRGHVAVLKDGSLYDYHGLCDFNTLAGYGRALFRSFEIRTHVTEKSVLRHFCKEWSRSLDLAVGIFERVVTMRETGTIPSTRQVSSAKKAIRRALPGYACAKPAVMRRKKKASRGDAS